MDIPQHILESIPVPIFVKDLRRRYTACNRAFEQMLGLDREEVLGRTIHDVAADEYAQASDEAETDVLENGTVQTYETGAVRKGGTLARDIVVSKAPLRDLDTGRIVGLVGVITDITERNRAREAVAESKTRLENILRSLVGTAVFVMDREGRYTFIAADPEFSRRLGGPAEQYVGMSIDEIAPPEQVRERMEDLRHIFDTGRRVQRRYESEGVDGKIIYDLALSPMIEPDGEVTGAVGFMRDTTRQAQFESELAETNARLRYLIDHSWDIILQVDLQGRHMLSNPAAVRLSGYTREELSAMSVFDLVVPEDQELIAERLRKRAAGGDLPPLFTFRMARKDGRQVTLEMTSSPIHRDGKIIGTQGIARDITERERNRTALAESERRYHSLVDNLPGAIYRCAFCAAWEMHFISDAIEEISGYPASDFIHNRVRSYASIIHADDREDVWEAVANGVARRAPYIIEYRIIHADGAVRWVYEKGQPIFIEGSDSPFLDGAIFDITDRRRAEAELQRVHRRLMNVREQERRRLAAELHDSIGQQLIGRQLAFERLLAERADRIDPELAEELSQFVDQSSDLIREIRNISHGLFPAALQELGLAAALEHLAGTIDHARMTVECPGTLTQKRFAPELEVALFRIAQEAVANAVRHGRAGRVEIALRRRSGELILTVTDDGEGFDPARADKGLGLITMSERADAVDGRLEVDSAPGRTRVTVRAPIQGAAE